MPAILFDFHSIIILISTVSHTRVLSSISMFFLSCKHELFSINYALVFKIAASVKDYIQMKQSGAYLSNAIAKNDSDVDPRSENDTQIISTSSIRTRYFHESEHQYVSLINSKVDQVGII